MKALEWNGYSGRQTEGSGMERVQWWTNRGLWNGTGTVVDKQRALEWNGYSGGQTEGSGRERVQW